VQHPRTLRQRCTGRADVIDDEDGKSLHVRRPADVEGTGNVRDSRLSVEYGLLRCVADARERRTKGCPETARYATCEQGRLVESALGETGAMQRNRYDDGPGELARMGLDGAPEKVAEWPREVRPWIVLESADGR
jgi:hypothetical protein